MSNRETSFPRIHLQWFAEPETGQEGNVPADSGSDTYFHTWEEPGGEIRNFSSPDELNNYLKENHMRHSDYTKKTMSLADEKRAFENTRQEFLNKQKEWQNNYSKTAQRDEQIKAYDQYLKNNPHVENKLRELMNQGPSEEDWEKRFDEIFQKKYGSKLEEIENWKRQQELSRQAEEAHNSLIAKYPDYDKDAIGEAFDALQKGDLSTLNEILYFSLRGRKTPEEIEQKLINDQVTKKSAGLIKGSGKQPATTDGDTYATIEEAAAAARRDGW